MWPCIQFCRKQYNEVLSTCFFVIRSLYYHFLCDHDFGLFHYWFFDKYMWTYFLHRNMIVYVCDHILFCCVYIFCQKPRKCKKNHSFPLIRIRNLMIDAHPCWMYEAGDIFFYRVHNLAFESMVCNYGISCNWKSKIRFGL